MEAVGRKIVIAYAYAVVKSFKAICICHVDLKVPPGAPAYSWSKLRRSYSHCVVFLALSGVTIVVLNRFVAANLGKHVTSDET